MRTIIMGTSILGCSIIALLAHDISDAVIIVDPNHKGDPIEEPKRGMLIGAVEKFQRLGQIVTDVSIHSTLIPKEKSPYGLYRNKFRRANRFLRSVEPRTRNNC